LLSASTCVDTALSHQIVREGLSCLGLLLVRLRLLLNGDCVLSLLLLIRFKLVVKSMELLALLEISTLAQLHQVGVLLPGCALEQIKLFVLLVHVHFR
jgi:hypothetical protein